LLIWYLFAATEKPGLDGWFEASTYQLKSKKHDLCAVLTLLEHLQILISCEGRWLDILVAITALLLQD
jgi:hypothetical protein